MSSAFDKLNLKPAERRLVIIVGIVVFLVLNAVFVWPEFSTWGKLQKRKAEAQRLFSTYQAEINNTERYQKQLSELQQAGAAVASEEQASRFSTTVYNQAALSGVTITRGSFERQGAVAKPNQFFDESVGTISVTMDEKALVDFLYNLGVGGSLIRVRTMSLNKDQSQQRLVGNITLVASYARKAPPAPARPAAAPATQAPAATPRATNTGTRPNFSALRASNEARANKPK
jgi:Tfp pilus assembly protein PilO